jgi:hypothetical protein
MFSENPSGAENQQETSSPSVRLNPSWIAGFVDGEGCFSVSVHRQPSMHRHRGWQIQAAFHVYQHHEHGEVLDALRIFFGCGTVRSKGPNSSVLTYSVTTLRDLQGVIVRVLYRRAVDGEEPGFPALRDDCGSDGAERTLVRGRVRESGPACVWHERQRQAAVQDTGRDP